MCIYIYIYINMILKLNGIQGAMGRSVTLHFIGGRDVSSKRRNLKTHPKEKCWHFSASSASLGIFIHPSPKRGIVFLFSHSLLTDTNT